MSGGDDVEVTVPPELVFAINRAITLNDAAERRAMRVRYGVHYTPRTHRPGCWCDDCPRYARDLAGTE